MSLVYNDDERMLAEAAHGFLQQHAPPAALRRLRDTRDADGFSRELWREMAALGWAGMLVPEEYGGLGFAHTGAGILCEQGGRSLAASPLFTTAILGATLLRECGTEAQKQALLPAIAAGRLLCALARWAESSSAGSSTSFPSIERLTGKQQCHCGIARAGLRRHV